MIPRDLESYIRVYENFFTDEFCQQVIESLDRANYQTHKFYHSKENSESSYDDDLSVTWDEIPEKQSLQNRLWFAIEQYVVRDMSMLAPHFAGWHGYSGVRFNRYDVNTQMHEHVDHITNLFDGSRRGIPILSLVGVLNDDYEGGEFIMWDDHEIKLRTGSVLIFPSVFLYKHRVQPVTNGVRHSYVSWVW